MTSNNSIVRKFAKTRKSVPTTMEECWNLHQEFVNFCIEDSATDGISFSEVAEAINIANQPKRKCMLYSSVKALKRALHLNEHSEALNNIRTIRVKRTIGGKSVVNRKYPVYFYMYDTRSTAADNFNAARRAYAKAVRTKMGEMPAEIAQRVSTSRVK